MSENKTYREGQEDTEPTPISQIHSAPSESSEGPLQVSEVESKVDATDPSKKVITAALLIQFADGRVDAITDLPQVEKNHVASLREVRLMAHSLIDDISSALQAKLTIAELKADVARSQAQNQLNSQISKIQNSIKLPGVKK
jgi:hypothetical protein